MALLGRPSPYLNLLRLATVSANYRVGGMVVEHRDQERMNEHLEGLLSNFRWVRFVASVSQNPLDLNCSKRAS